MVERYGFSFTHNNVLELKNMWKFEGKLIILDKEVKIWNKLSRKWKFTGYSFCQDCCFS